MGLMKQLFERDCDKFVEYCHNIGIDDCSDHVIEQVFADVQLGIVLTHDEFEAYYKSGLAYLAKGFMDGPNQVDNAMKKLILSSNMVDSNSEIKLDIKYVKKNGDIEDFIIKVLDIEEEICYAINCMSGMTEMFHVDRITEVKEHNEDAGKDAV